MEREIKFRGKSLDTGKWEYGYVIFDTLKENANIVNKKGMNEMQMNAVNPNTVGEFVGLFDKNGKECYEGDFATINNEVCIVTFSQFFTCGWEFKSQHIGSYPFSGVCTSFNNTGCKDFEIIGNATDNPELLK